MMSNLLQQIYCIQNMQNIFRSIYGESRLHRLAIWCYKTFPKVQMFGHNDREWPTYRSYLFPYDLESLWFICRIKYASYGLYASNVMITFFASHVFVCGFGSRNSKFRQPGILRTYQRTLELLTSSKQDLARPLDDICTD